MDQLIVPSSVYFSSLKDGLSSDPEGITMPIQAYFDESGKLGENGYVAFGGAAALDTSWPAITSRWLKILKPYGMISISMKDAVRFENAFAGWENRIKERDELLCDLARAAVIDIEFFTVSCMSLADFKALSREEQRAFKDPVYYGFVGCMHQLLDRAPANEPIQISCDNSEKYSGKCLELYHQLRQANPSFRKRCGHIAFGEDQWFTGLQLADVYVYCVRHLAWNKQQPNPLVASLMSILDPHGYVEDDYIWHPHVDFVSGRLERGERIVRQ
jgi:Protein of unknown function (DUF3800)